MSHGTKEAANDLLRAQCPHVHRGMRLPRSECRQCLAVALKAYGDGQVKQLARDILDCEGLAVAGEGRWKAVAERMAYFARRALGQERPKARDGVTIAYSSTGGDYLPPDTVSYAELARIQEEARTPPLEPTCFQCCGKGFYFACLDSYDTSSVPCFCLAGRALAASKAAP